MMMLRNFNSIKVRLEQSRRTDIPLFLSFQFHKGTIRTVGFLRLPGSCYRFQFHKGTIRTKSHSPEVIVIVYFNSIKVRLEPNYVYQD